MLENVWEWVQDWCGDYLGGAVTDPQFRPEGTIDFVHPQDAEAPLL